MKNNLNKEEKEIFESFERGEWKSVPNLDERKKEIKGYVKTYISSILHKFVNGRLVERS